MTTCNHYYYCKCLILLSITSIFSFIFIILLVATATLDGLPPSRTVLNCFHLLWFYKLYPLLGWLYRLLGWSYSFDNNNKQLIATSIVTLWIWQKHPLENNRHLHENNNWWNLLYKTLSLNIALMKVAKFFILLYFFILVLLNNDYKLLKKCWSVHI